MALCRAGERRGQGFRGRLTVYGRGKAGISGLGEAVLGRALVGQTFVQEHLDRLISGHPKRASGWAQDAVRWAFMSGGL
jgi:L-alanine-DL-glutamate epimerase-like enolase superfamily enzyme